MTSMFLLKDLQKALVGFEEFLHSPMTTYPPYNLSKTETGYQIDIAVAGFDRSDIKVYENQGYLVVEGSQPESYQKAWLHHGLAGRSFKKSFALNGQLQVTQVTLVNGVITITLEVSQSHQIKTYEIQ